MSDESDDFNLNDEDLLDAINPFRKKSKLTKEQAVYGIWAESEEDEDPKESLTTSTNGKSIIMNNPINFKMSSNSVNNKLNDINILKSSRSVHIHEKKFNHNYIANEKKGNGFAAWDQHTSGFGMKMLLKMGYKPGKGLGKDQSGIVEPIKATVRQGKVGLGADEHELENNIKTTLVKFEEDKKKDQKTLANWRKSSDKINRRYTYRTLGEIQGENENKINLVDNQQKQTSSLSQVKVIDMRGKQTQIHEDYDSFSKVESESKKRLFRRFDVPELVANIKHVLNVSEKKISDLYRKNRTNQDLLINYNYELDLLNKQIDNTSSNANRIKTVIEMIKGCFVLPTATTGNKINQCRSDIICEQELSCIDPLTALNYNLDVLEKLSNFPEYFEYKLSTLCVSFFVGWIELLIAKYGVIQLNHDVIEFFNKWCQFIQNELSQKSLFNVFEVKKFVTTSELYDQILWNYMLPPLRNSINDYTQPLPFCNDLVKFISEWEYIFPHWLIQHILIQIIYPKLKDFTEKWDPKDNTIPIHKWIQPWLHFFENKEEITEQLFYIIQMKLCSIFREWHPSEITSKKMLVPWLNLFSQNSINNILFNMIIPKLKDLLTNDLVINPSNQNIEHMKQFLEWYSIIPDTHMADMLDKHFFIKWLTTLHCWLKQDNPNFEEIALWYKGWKGVIPKSLLIFDSIQRNMRIALYMIDYTSQGQDIGTNLNHFISYYDECQKQINAIKIDTQKATIKVSNIRTNNFKEMVEQYASEKGILFKPLATSIRFNDGKTYYQFGNTIIYIDRGVLFVDKGIFGSNPTSGGVTKWQPISLQELVELAMR